MKNIYKSVVIAYGMKGLTSEIVYDLLNQLPHSSDNQWELIFSTHDSLKAVNRITKEKYIVSLNDDGSKIDILFKIKADGKINKKDYIKII